MLPQILFLILVTMKRVILLQIIFGFLNKTVICDFLNLCCPEGSIYTQIVSPNQVKSEWITGFIGREKVNLLLGPIGERPPMLYVTTVVENTGKLQF